MRYIFRLARVSAHYGLLKWVGSQIIDLFTKPKTASDLKILSETVAAMGSLERWIPELHEDGPDHRFILGKLHELFNKLGTHKALSFLDAALLMPAVRYDREKWPALVCAALERYDVTGTEVIPDDWPTFGSASHPEGVGVYDFRTLLARVVRDVTVTQFEIGTKALVAKSVAGDPASSSLLEILEKEKLLMEKREIVSRFPQAAFPFVNIVEPARIFLMGPAYIYAVHQGLFRFVTGTDITEWSQRNWALATEMLEQSFDNFSRFAPITLAFWPGRERVVRDVPEAVAPAEMESAEKRSYVKFRTATSPIIRATTKRGRNA